MTLLVMWYLCVSAYIWFLLSDAIGGEENTLQDDGDTSPGKCI